MQKKTLSLQPSPGFSIPVERVDPLRNLVKPMGQTLQCMNTGYKHHFFCDSHSLNNSSLQIKLPILPLFLFFKSTSIKHTESLVIRCSSHPMPKRNRWISLVIKVTSTLSWLFGCLVVPLLPSNSTWKLMRPSRGRLAEGGTISPLQTWQRCGWGVVKYQDP